MEEDIKILKGIQTDLINYTDVDYENRVVRERIKAIENILNRLEQDEKVIEELNKKLKRYEKYLQKQKEKTEELLEYEYTEREQDYIPKSVIREKIEELDKKMHETFEGKLQEYTPGEMICFKKMLKELLGEE